MTYGTSTYGAGVYGAEAGAAGGYGAGVYGAAVYGASAGGGGGPDPEPEPGPEDPLFERIPVAIEMAFDHGPGALPAEGDWTDVTTHLDLTPSSGGASTYSGRDSIRAGITPGTLALAVENNDGAFNPRNPAGPYYGRLNNGTPIRVRVTVDGVDHIVWSGFISSGFPQDLAARYRTVTIAGHDIVGIAAQGEAPTSAWAAAVAAAEPAHRWRPGPDGWIDSVTGLVATHTGMLAQRDANAGGPAYIDGEEPPWGAPAPEGYGVIDADDARIDTNAADVTVAARILLPTVADRVAATGLTESQIEMYLVHQSDLGPLQRSPFTLSVTADSVKVAAHTASTYRVASTAPGEQAAELFDGRPHTLVVHAPAVAGDVRVWLDGRELEIFTTAVAAATTQQLGPLYFGAAPSAQSALTSGHVPFTGYIDPVVVVYGQTGSAADALAGELHSAATVAWAGQMLDQRLVAVVDGLGLAAHFGPLDPSGIVTMQGYRHARPLELLQTIENTEQGLVYVDRSGRLCFARRSWSWDRAVAAEPQVTFSDDPALLDAGDAEELLEGGATINDDPLNLCNVATVTSEHGREQTAENAASIAVHGRRGAVSLTGLLHPTDRQSLAIAEWIVLSQGSAEIEARELRFRVEDHPEVLAPLAATIEPGWLVRLLKVEPDVGVLDLAAHVLAVAHDFRFTGWTVTLTLDSTRAGYDFFRWGESTWGGAAGWSF